MKNLKTNMSRLIAVFATLVLLTSAILIPVSAVTPGSDPILSGSEYGVSYADGIYTLSLDAERLAEIISTKSFDKETLKSIMPEAVYEFIKNRDTASAMELLRDLYSAADLKQLIDDLPLSAISNRISKEDILKVVDVDMLFAIIDTKEIITALSEEELETALGGKDLSEFVSLDTVEDYILANPSVKAALEQDITDGKFGTISSIDDLKNITYGDLISYIPKEDLAELLLDVGPKELIKAADIEYVISLPEVRDALKNIKAADIKAAFDLSAIKTDILPGLVQFILGDIKYVKFNDTVVFLNGQLDVAALELALLNALPTFDKVAELGADGKAASFVIAAHIDGKEYKLGFELKFTGDTTQIKSYAARLAEYISVDFADDGLIDIDIKTPAKLAELYIKALDTDRLPQNIKDKLGDIAILEFNKGDISRFADAVLNKLTIAEIKDVLASVDIGKYDDILLDKLNLYESQAETLRNYIVKAVNKACDILESSATVDDILSVFYDKSVEDFYVGNSVFSFTGDATIDLMAYANKVITVPDYVESALVNTTIAHKVDINAEITGLYKVDFIDQGEVLYSAFRTEGYDLGIIAADDKLIALAPNGWASADGTMINSMPAEDVELAAVHTITFIAYDIDDTVAKTYIKYYTELTDMDNFVYPPSLPNNIPHYYFLWPMFEATGEDMTVIGKYYPILYTATFMNGDEVWDVIKYTVKNVDSFKLPELPVKDGYTASWDMTTLPLEDVTINAVFEEIEYSIKFYANGTLVDTQYYTVNDKSIAIPAVPAKEGFTGKWEDFTLTTGDIIVNAIYTPDGSIEESYTVTFKADGIIIDTIVLNKGETAFTEPTVPAKNGYTGKWEDYTLNDTDITVNAVYTPIEYTITFIADGKIVSTITFNIETMNSVVAPEVPAKENFTGKWEDYTLSTESIEVNAIYTAIKYNITFVADGKEVAKIEFNKGATSVNEPAVPSKNGYTGEWESYSLKDATGDITVNAKYTAIQYKVNFYADGKLINTQYYSVENRKITEPAVPAKEGFTGKWSSYSLNGIGDVNVNAEYTAIVVPVEEYTVTFKADGQVVASIKFNKGATSVDEPAVPAKKGYTGAWESYSIKDATGDITVNAKYTAITYYITFVDKNDQVVGEAIPFTVETIFSDISFPVVPELAGYVVAWPESSAVEDLFLSDEIYDETESYSFKVSAIYTAIEYTATLVVDGETFQTIKFTVEDSKDALLSRLPAVPDKAGYTGSWNDFEIGTNDITIDAIYTPVSYSVTFIADGNVVATLYYTVENPTVTAPEVPAKEGFTGKWEDFTLTTGDVTVNAIYTEVEETGCGGFNFWWIMIIVLVLALGVLFSIFKILTKPKKNAG